MILFIEHLRSNCESIIILNLLSVRVPLIDKNPPVRPGLRWSKEKKGHHKKTIVKIEKDNKV